MKEKQLKLRKRKIERYLDKYFQYKIKNKWAKDLRDNPKWKQLSNKLNLKPDNMAPYLNKEIEDEIMIKFDRRLWQTLIFRVFIYKRLNKTKSPLIRVSHIVKFITNKSSLLLNYDLIYTKDLNKLGY